MNKINYLIVRNKSIPSITKWTKKGLILFSNNINEINIDELFSLDPVNTIDLIDDFIEQVEIKKQFIQLMEVKKYLLEQYELHKQIREGSLLRTHCI